MKLEWALLILFSFISTYLLEVFRLMRFQRALPELYVPCHYWFYWVLAMIRTIHTALFCCLWEISTLWPCSVQRENHVMTEIMILTHWKGLWRLMFVQASEWYTSQWCSVWYCPFKEASVSANEWNCCVSFHVQYANRELATELYLLQPTQK